MNTNYTHMFLIFNFIMLKIYFFEFSTILPFCLNFFIYWFFFFKINFFNVRVKNLNSDVLSNVSLNNKIHFSLYVRLNLLFIIFLFLNLYLIKGTSNTIWWNHLIVNNFNLSIIQYIIFINIIVLLITNTLTNNKLNYNPDFFFAIINLSIFLPFIFFSNNIFSFFFILEVNSCLIFYKFIVSKLWYKNSFNYDNINLTKLNKILPKSLINVLFFQYWATFFSTTLLLFFIINILYMFGTTNWAELNFLIYSNVEILYFKNKIWLNILSFLFLFSFIIKVGLTPLHLFKIEIYKGIPFLSIFFYTTYYFLVFFLYFSFILLHNLSSLFLYWWLYLLIIIIFGGFYTISLLFNINFIKAFFAYSTIVNCISFICLVFVNLC